MAQSLQPDSFRAGKKKREIMTGELREKLSCKYDYVKYFKEACKSTFTFYPKLCSIAVRAAKHHAE